MAKKKQQSQTPAAKAARARRAAAKDARTIPIDPHAAPSGLAAPTEKANVPTSATEPTQTEEEHAKEQSANAAAEVARRRREPGTGQDADEGPDVGRVDNRVDTSFETQQMPRPARPLTPVTATAERVAPAPRGDDEEPLTVDPGYPKKVRAVKLGYLRHARRRAGDVFLIYNAAEFSPRWMEFAGASDPEKITTGQQTLEQERRKTLEDRLAAKKAGGGTGDANVLGATA